MPIHLKARSRDLVAARNARLTADTVRRYRELTLTVRHASTAPTKPRILLFDESHSPNGDGLSVNRFAINLAAHQIIYRRINDLIVFKAQTSVTLRRMWAREN